VTTPKAAAANVTNVKTLSLGQRRLFRIISSIRRLGQQLVND